MNAAKLDPMVSFCLQEMMFNGSGILVKILLLKLKAKFSNNCSPNKLGIVNTNKYTKILFKQKHNKVFEH